MKRTPPPTPAEILRARGKLGPYTQPAQEAPAPAEDPAAVRAWAAVHDVEVAARGPIPASVLARYREEGP
ncbi:MAG: histone-like nucleoid-structuring protein Lsr2 [Micromonosporaceae bacterium]